MLTDREVSRCEARLGLVALFMPTQPDGEYKLNLRGFADRQILTLLLREYAARASMWKEALKLYFSVPSSRYACHHTPVEKTRHDQESFGSPPFSSPLTNVTGLERSDPTLQLLGMRHDGKFLEEGSASWAAGIPKRGRFRTR